LATGDITNFVSAMGLGGGVAAQFGHGLSFANSSNGESNSPPNYGGGFGNGGLPCIPDYYGQANGTPVAGSTFTWPAGTGTFNYYANSAEASGYLLTIGSGSTITVPVGQTINLYVYGDVYIKNDIKY